MWPGLGMTHVGVVILWGVGNTAPRSLPGFPLFQPRVHPPDVKPPDEILCFRRYRPSPCAWTMSVRTAAPKPAKRGSRVWPRT